MSGLPAEFVRAIALRHDVTKFELEVLLPALEGDSIKTIAKEKQLEEAAVRKRLGKVYDKFVVPWTGPGKLAKLEQMLISEYLAQKNQNESAISRQRNSWEDAPDLTAFFGRQLELKELKRWVGSRGTRTIRWRHLAIAAVPSAFRATDCRYYACRRSGHPSRKYAAREGARFTRSAH
jgi:hypothetical protein